MESQEIPMRTRIQMWLAAWFVTAVAMIALAFSPAILLYAWTFPLGLAHVFSHRATQGRLGLTVLIAGWTFYLLLSIRGLRQSRRVRFYVSYAVLCLLLATNVGGCHVMLRDGLSVSGTVSIRPPKLIHLAKNSRANTPETAQTNTAAK
jgi:hypothetical protein